MKGTLMNILTFYLRTNTGWAALIDGGVTSGTENFKPGRFEGGGMCYLIAVLEGML